MVVLRQRKPRCIPCRLSLWIILCLLTITVPQPTVFARSPQATPQTIPDGRILFSSNRDRTDGVYNLFSMKSDGSDAINLTNWHRNNWYAHGNWNGTRVVFASDRGRGVNENHIYVMDADGSNLIRLTNDTGQNVAPTWSPDGTKIAFTSNLPSANTEIHVMNADGTGRVNLTKSSAPDGWPSWSPDGSQIVFSSNVNGNVDLYVMNSDGSGRRRLTTSWYQDLYPSWSPDSTRIAFSVIRNDSRDIYVINADGSNEVRLTTDPAADEIPSWSPDGNYIAFESYRNGKGDIYVMDADGSNQHNVTNNPANDIFASWAPSNEPPDTTRLILETPVESTLAPLSQQYFALTVPANRSLVATVTPVGNSAPLWLHSRANAIPTPALYDQRTLAPTPGGTYALALAPTRAATYYFSVYNRSTTGAPAAFRIVVNAVDRGLLDVFPRSAGNAGPVTLFLSGVGFSANSQVQLRDAAGATVSATNVRLLSNRQLLATVDLSGATPGTYTVEVVATGQAPLTLADAFTITTGKGAHLEARIEAPTSVRPQRVGTVWLHYANTGDADLPAPVFTIANAGNPLPMKLRPDDPYQSGPVQVLGISQSGGAAGVLSPGASGRIPISFRSDTSGLNIRFDLSVLEAGDQVIDWAAIEADLRPSDVSAELWPLIWNRFVAQVGSTGADYQRALTERASHLSQYGEYVSDVRSLLGMMLNEAAGSAAQVTLAASLDATAPATALPLAFGRVATSDAVQRFTPGPFGAGWRHNLAYTLQRSDQSTVMITGPTGATRRFVKNHAGAWQGEAGDPGALSQPGGGYRLTEVSGLQWQFDASGQLTTISEPNGNRITLGYSGENLTQISHSNGQQFTLEYNGQGRISRLTDHAGRATVYSYDGSGLYLQQVTALGGLATSYSYTGASNTLADHALREIAYADGTHRSFSYDEAGRLTATWRDGDAERVSYAYDAFGTVTVSDAAGNSSVLQRGSAGQPLQVENALGEQVRFAYDANFNLTSVIMSCRTFTPQ
ncbi:MAG: hypothetical protein HGA65_08545, partial [Oscillochloris sp.]|nr:hypothetical protein [Oscillochloris sp.]